MISRHSQIPPNQKSQPQKRQRSPFFIRHVRIVLVVAWSLPLLAIVWGVAIFFISRNLQFSRYSLHSSDSSWDMDGQNYITILLGSHSEGQLVMSQTSNIVQSVRAILFACAIQGAQTIGLHCVETLVNIRRDENAWHAANLPRKRSKAGSEPIGAPLNVSALRAAASNWENAIQFTFKVVLHWLLGRSFHPFFYFDFDSWGYGFDMMYLRIFVYFIIAAVLALFATYLAFQMPKGPQPATYGNLQSLANLVDDWGAGKESSLWWGDKGLNANGTRRAGTSADLKTLGKIHMDADYEGLLE
jgi:hypothetical protein